MEISIRNAISDDYKIIEKLTNELGYNSNGRLLQDRLVEILKKNDSCVFVAIENRKIIGWIHGLYCLRIQSDPYVEIVGLVVTEKYRKKGFGKKLVESVFNWSQSKNCKKIRVRCNTLRTESHKFYEKMEFKQNKEQKVFDRILSKIQNR